MAVEGSLDLFQLPEILQIISQEGKTGILTVQGQDDIVAISFLNGRVVAADALNKTLEDGLGEVLLERQIVTRQAFESSQAEKRRSGGRLMDLLVDSGALDRGELLEALRTLTFDLLAKLLAWREGEFKFYGGDEVSYEEGFRPISVEDLLLANLPDEVEAPPAAPPTAPEPRETPASQARPASPEPVKPVPKAPAETAGSPASRASSPAARAPAPRPVGPPDLGDAPLRPGGAPVELPVTVPVPARRKPRPAPVKRPIGDQAAARSGAEGTRVRQGLAWGIAFLAAAAIAVVLATVPSALVMPSPANSVDRVAFRESRREARYAKIESALRAYGLFEGRLPDQLELLVHMKMLSPDEVRGPLGQSLLYQAQGLEYQLRPLLKEESAAYSGTFRGDFLLDPDLFQGRDEGTTKPLVLLD